MKLYVARHTQTNYNVQNLIDYDPAVDVHLTLMGIEQAKELAAKLADKHFDTIYVSDLPRTQETASYLQQYEHVPIVKDARLNEQISGFEGRTLDEYFKARDNSPNRLSISFNGGESLLDVKARVKEFLSYLRTTDLSSVLIVTHGVIVECTNELLNNTFSADAATLQLKQGDYQVYDI